MFSVQLSTQSFISFPITKRLQETTSLFIDAANESQDRLKILRLSSNFPINENNKNSDEDTETTIDSRISSFDKAISSSQQNGTETQVSDEPLENFHNVQYYGYIYLGTPPSNHTVIFDTGSDILWLPSVACKQCRDTAHRFNPAESTSFTNTTKPKSITYAVGYVEGVVCKDDITLDRSLITKQYNFLLVDKEEKLGHTMSDGVLGLGINTEGDESNSLVKSMYNQGLISSPKFTVILGDENQQSRLYIGDIFSNQYIGKHLDKSKFDRCETSGNKYWACVIGGIEVVSKNRNRGVFSHKAVSKEVVFDTGTSFLMIPYYDFNNILESFLKAATAGECALNSYLQLICKCNNINDFPDILLTVGTGVIRIVSKNLIYFIKDSKYQCQFQILTTLDKEFNIWILGDSVLRSMIVEFDMKAQMISFASKKTLFDEMSEANKGLIIKVIWVLVALFFVLIVIFIYRYVKRKLSVESELNERSQRLMES